MSMIDISQAKNADLMLSIAAVQRAAQAAQQVATQTNTAVVWVVEGKVVKVEAEQLRRQGHQP